MRKAVASLAIVALVAIVAPTGAFARGPGDGTIVCELVQYPKFYKEVCRYVK